jgi:hypothetical protein
MGIGIAGLIVLVLNIYAIIMILDSSAKALEKLVWALVIIMLPVLGVVFWYFAGPGRKPF